MLRMGCVLLNSHARVCSNSNSSPIYNKKWINFSLEKYLNSFDKFFDYRPKLPPIEKTHRDECNPIAAKTLKQYVQSLEICRFWCIYFSFEFEYFENIFSIAYFKRCSINSVALYFRTQHSLSFLFWLVNRIRCFLIFFIQNTYWHLFK